MAISTSQSAGLDFTGMYAAHDSFRRDLDRLVEAAGRGTAEFHRVHLGWENFKVQLHVHHQAEDAVLWPRLQELLNGAPPAQLRIIVEMQAEHALIEPLLARVDDATSGRGSELGDVLGELAGTIRAHLDHEEKEALPLVDAALSFEDWRAFISSIRRAQGVRGAARYLPWVLDGTPTDRQRKFFDDLPALLRAITRLVWQPRYRRSHLWR